MSLVALSTVLQRRMAIDAWIADQEMRGEKVEMYRNYADGDHPANMTAEMRAALRAVRPDGSSEFTANDMDTVIQMPTDRTVLDTIDADTDAASAWAQEVMEASRIDALNLEVHESAYRDGDTFLMVHYDNDGRRAVFTHELAYDGRSGMMVLYRSDDSSEMDAAIKIWNITSTSGTVQNTTRINVYYPDRIQKYTSTDGGAFMPFVDDDTDADGVAPWLDRNNQPLGIPVFHFKNRGRKNYGLSEIESAIPLQDAKNRMLHSLVMSSELTAFQVRVAKGFVPKAGITPGGWITITGQNGGPLTKEDVAEVDVLESGDLTQQLAAIQWVSSEIMRVTRTPAPEFMGGDNASGESLKQREIGLLGKVRRFQVTAGNVWEDAMGMAWKIEAAFGTQPPAYKRFYARWVDAEVRNDTETIKNALMLKDTIGEREFLRLIAPIFKWDEARIDSILAENAAERSKRISELGSSIPSFGNFGDGLNADEKVA
jgi:hypothetical protein